MADDVEAFAALRRWATTDVFAGTIVTRHVERGRGEITGRMAEVARDGKRFEKNLRHDHRRPDVQHDSVLELRHDRSEPLKIEMGRLAEHRAIGRGMLVDDVRADGDVDGDGDIAGDPLMEKAQLAI